MSVLWLATRATGEVAMILLTITTVLGVLQIAASSRLGIEASSRSQRDSRGQAIPGITTPQGVENARHRSLASRLLNARLHRSISLLAVVFLAVHIATTVLDSYVSVSWWAAVIPFASAYETGAVALGALAVDLLIIVIVTSLLRTHLNPRHWRLIHLSAYAAWALGAAHGLLAGTDQTLTLTVTLLGVLAITGALLVRLFGRRRRQNDPATDPARTTLDPHAWRPQPAWRPGARHSTGHRRADNHEPAQRSQP